VKNDSPSAFEGSCIISSLSFETGQISRLSVLDFSGTAALPAGAGTKQLFNVTYDMPSTRQLLLASCSSDTSVLPRVTAYGADAANLVSFNEIALTTPELMQLPEANVVWEVADAPNADGSIDILLSTDKAAVYVTLTTLAHGHFSDNAFAMKAGAGRLQFIPFGPLDRDLLRRSLRLEHLQQYQRSWSSAFVEYI